MKILDFETARRELTQKAPGFSGEYKSVEHPDTHSMVNAVIQRTAQGLKFQPIRQTTAHSYKNILIATSGTQYIAFSFLLETMALRKEDHVKTPVDFEVFIKSEVNEVIDRGTGYPYFSIWEAIGDFPKLRTPSGKYHNQCAACGKPIA